MAKDETRETCGQRIVASLEAIAHGDGPPYCIGGFQALMGVDLSTSKGVSHFLAALVNDAPPDAAMLPVDGATTELRASVAFPDGCRGRQILRYRVIVERIEDEE